MPYYQHLKKIKWLKKLEKNYLINNFKWEIKWKNKWAKILELIKINKIWGYLNLLKKNLKIWQKSKWSCKDLIQLKLLKKLLNKLLLKKWLKSIIRKIIEYMMIKCLILKYHQITIMELLRTFWKTHNKN